MSAGHVPWSPVLSTLLAKEGSSKWLGTQASQEPSGIQWCLLLARLNVWMQHCQMLHLSESPGFQITWRVSLSDQSIFAGHTEHLEMWPGSTLECGHGWLWYFHSGMCTGGQQNLQKAHTLHLWACKHSQPTPSNCSESVGCLHTLHNGNISGTFQRTRLQCFCLTCCPHTTHPSFHSLLICSLSVCVCGCGADAQLGHLLPSSRNQPGYKINIQVAPNYLQGCCSTNPRRYQNLWVLKHADLSPPYHLTSSNFLGP